MNFGKNRWGTVLFAFVFFIVFFPLMTSAQVPRVGVNPGEQLGTGQGILSFADILSSVNGIIVLVVSFIVAISVLYMILGGFAFVTSGGDENKIEVAKKRILYGVIGIAVMILAVSVFYIVKTFLIGGGSPIPPGNNY